MAINVDIDLMVEESPEVRMSVDNIDEVRFGVDPSILVGDHDKLINRDADDQHPISAITGLEEALEQSGRISTVQRNGVDLPIVNKTVNIQVPVKTSDLTNDSGFITESDIPVTSVNGMTGDVVVSGLPSATEDGTALVYVNGEWTKQTGYGYKKTIRSVFVDETVTTEGEPPMGFIQSITGIPSFDSDYTVTVDGVSYVTSPWVYQGIYLLGNGEIVGLQDGDPNCPFLFTVVGSDAMFATFTSGEYAVRVEGDTATYIQFSTNFVVGQNMEGLSQRFMDVSGVGKKGAIRLHNDDTDPDLGNPPVAIGGFSAAVNHGCSVGDLSFAENCGIANGSGSHAEGYGVTGVDATYAHAEGYGKANGVESHAEGNATANGSTSHAEGNHNAVANGICSHAEGSGRANGSYSHAEGSETTSGGSYSHAEGDRTTASGTSSHAEGNLTEASSTFAHAEGYHTTASGSTAHSEGGYTTASGDRSHSEGYYTVASGNYSHSEGAYTTASRRSQHTFGEYNIIEEGSKTSRGIYVEIVGNGAGTANRSNARTLDWNGNETLAGKLTVGADPANNMDVATKQYVDGAIPTVPTKTSDLTNDSGFITASDVPKEVFLVNVTPTNQTMTQGISDKTSQEIYEASLAGKLPVVQVNVSTMGIAFVAPLALAVNTGDGYIADFSYDDQMGLTGVPYHSVIRIGGTTATISHWGSAFLWDLDQAMIVSALGYYPVNESSLATVATSGSYNDLTDRPTIPIVPTNVSAFTNDAGYLVANDFVEVTDAQIHAIVV